MNAAYDCHTAPFFEDMNLLSTTTHFYKTLLLKRYEINVKRNNNVLCNISKLTLKSTHARFANLTARKRRRHEQITVSKCYNFNCHFIWTMYCKYKTTLVPFVLCMWILYVERLLLLHLLCIGAMDPVKPVLRLFVHSPHHFVSE